MTKNEVKKKTKNDKERLKQSILAMYNREKRTTEILEHVLNLIYEISTQSRDDAFTNKIMLSDIEELCFTAISELYAKENN